MHNKPPPQLHSCVTQPGTQDRGTGRDSTRESWRRLVRVLVIVLVLALALGMTDTQRSMTVTTLNHAALDLGTCKHSGSDERYQSLR
ncbi:hypothetical protein SKAU_G00158690 [Synaphobranchus kaupii]|uniref:Uncharacterized protein n=1 Tax=Synaphobranchus kaupii TaxID=118154 RepID=A0A9Q1FI26_SYNKA|nr:hypothetical protein SKAU_G00158690 [Synaphobranchus kaupii]